MPVSDSESLFRAWGLAYSEGPWAGVDPAVRYRRSAESHPLARAAAFAPGKRGVSKTSLAYQLSGITRRRFMGQAAGLPAVPRWAVDTVPARETRRTSRSDRAVHPMLARVDHAVREMEKRNMIRGMCFRLKYCMDGTDTDKLIELNCRMKQISKGYAGIALKRYRDEVHDARIAVEGWLAGFDQAQRIEAKA